MNRIRTKDITGFRSGFLVVLDRAEDYVGSNGRHYAMWNCKCGCGGTRIVRANDILRKRVISCGCKRKYSLPNGKKKGSKATCNEFDMSNEDYGICITNNGDEIIFDKEDYDLIKDYYWSCTKSKKNKYAQTCSIKGENTVGMARLVINSPNDMQVDHINHNTLDNRKANLRLCSNSQNSMNRGVICTNTSGITGVSFQKSICKYVAYIKVNGKRIHLGSFSDKKDAAKARENAEIKYFGEYRFNK